MFDMGNDRIIAFEEPSGDKNWRNGRLPSSELPMICLAAIATMPGDIRLVPDRRIRNIPEVILVRRWVSWGSGNLEGEGWVRVG